MIHEARPFEDPRLVAELGRRFLAGEIVVGQEVDVDGRRLRVDGFDPVSAQGRRVYLSTQEGESLAIQIPSH